MAGFVPSQFPSQYGELERVARQHRAHGSYSAADAVLRGLVHIGAPLTAMAGRLRAALAGRRNARRQARNPSSDGS